MLAPLQSRERRYRVLLDGRDPDLLLDLELEELSLDREADLLLASYLLSLVF